MAYDMTEATILRNSQTICVSGNAKLERRIHSCAEGAGRLRTPSLLHFACAAAFDWTTLGLVAWRKCRHQERNVTSEVGRGGPLPSGCQFRVDVKAARYWRFRSFGARGRLALSGPEVIEKLKTEFNRDIPTLIVTGDTTSERLREANTRGYQLMHKPVQPAMLRTFLGNLRRRKYMA